MMMTAEEFFKSIGVEFGTPAASLKGYRARDGMTQQELADKLKVKQTHISEMEHGKRTIGKAMAKKLAQIFRADYKMFL